MMTKRVKMPVVLGAAFVIAVIALIWWFRKEQFFEIDQCLDRGGCWNAERQQCQFDDACPEP